MTWFAICSAGMESEAVSEWSCADVSRWLAHNGFEDYADILCYSHKIDGKVQV